MIATRTNARPKPGLDRAVYSLCSRRGLGEAMEAGGVKLNYALRTPNLRADGKLLAEKNCKTRVDDAIRGARSPVRRVVCAEGDY